MKRKGQIRVNKKHSGSGKASSHGKSYYLRTMRSKKAGLKSKNY